MIISEIIYWLTLIPLLVFTSIAVYNFLQAPRLKKNESKIRHALLVSVLIPARNEEKNIGICLQSVLNQNYKNLEIIVLDDNSDDRTAEIVNKYTNEKIKLVKGEVLPQGWLGKNWACSQLSKYAGGELILFLDADVILSKDAISSVVDIWVENKLKMLSVFPTQYIFTLGEHLIVPLMNWLLLNFLPLTLVFSSDRKSFAAANGQFILFEKKTYNSINGHESVKDKVVEDMELARELKKRGEKIMTLVGDKTIKCRMYNDFKNSFAGFSKNFFPGFNTSPVVFAVLIFFLLLEFFLPFLLVFINYKFISHVVVILAGRIFVSLTSMQNFVFNILLHPIQMIVMLFVGINSLIKTINNQIEWKGRKIKLN